MNGINSDADNLTSLLSRLTVGFDELAEPRQDDVPDMSDDDDEPTLGGGAAVKRVTFEDGTEGPEPDVVDRFEVRVGARTDVGTKLTSNEDAMLVLPEVGLYAVADGMGGHTGGEIASQLAVEAIARTFSDPAPSPLVMLNLPPQATQIVQGIAAANEAIRSMAARTPWRSEMGTTVVALRFAPEKGHVYVAHVGDSRCYRLRAGKLEQLTHDHTMAEFGVSGKEARRLSRAVGSNGIVEADLTIVAPRSGDVFLLCSDGLTKALGEPEIIAILDEEPDPDTAARALVARARELLARDNVTVVIARVTERLKRPSSSP